LRGACWAQIRPELQAPYPALAAADRPATVEAWLNRSAVPAIVRRLAGKELTHRALDELPAGKTVEHLRSALSLRQGAQLAKMVRWYTPAEVLTMATLQNAELLSLSLSLWASQPLPGYARSRRIRGDRRSAADRRGSARGHHPAGPTGKFHARHHEGWGDRQEPGFGLT